MYTLLVLSCSDDSATVGNFRQLFCLNLDCYQINVYTCINDDALILKLSVNSTITLDQNENCVIYSNSAPSSGNLLFASAIKKHVKTINNVFITQQSTAFNDL